MSLTTTTTPGVLTSNVSSREYIVNLPAGNDSIMDGTGRSIPTTINSACPESVVKGILGTDTTNLFNSAWMYEGSTEENPDTAYFHRYYPSNQAKGK